MTKITMADTARLMLSDNYKTRFIAEYWQTKIRYDRLHRIAVETEAGTCRFRPKCSLEMLNRQLAYMGNYLKCLEVRAEIEEIDLRVIPEE